VAHGFGEVPDEQVHLDRVTQRRGVPAAVDRHHLPAGPAGQRHADVVGHDPVLVTVHDQDRAPYLPADGLGVGGAGFGNRRDGQQQRLGGGVQAPGHPVLMWFGRVRLGEHLRHEELDPAAVVGQPVVPVGLAPALVGVLGLVEAGRHRPGQRRADRDHPGRPFGIPGGQLQRVPATHGQADDHGPVHPDGVQHGDRVIDVLTVAVGLRGPGTVGTAIAPAFDGDHLEVAR
jgi:hypothetical protein